MSWFLLIAVTPSEYTTDMHFYLIALPLFQSKLNWKFVEFVFRFLFVFCSIERNTYWARYEVILKRQISDML